MGRLDYVEPSAGGIENHPSRAGNALPSDASLEARRSASVPPAATPSQTATRRPSRSAPGTQVKPTVPAAKSGAAPPGEGRRAGSSSAVIHGLAALSPPAPDAPPRDAPPTPLFDATATPAEPPTVQPAELDELTEDPSIPVLEPTFLRTKKLEGSRAGRIALRVACGLLAPALVLQLAVLFRSTLIIHFPDLQPAMAALCAPLACSAQWPMRPELLAVVSSDLQAVPGTSAMELDAVIRNRAEFPMALPALELTLTDSLNHPLARKVFTPADYLATPTGPDASDNLAAGADLSIRLVFEFHGVGVAGFLAYPFYP